jgi:hypothetical protein
MTPSSSLKQERARFACPNDRLKQASSSNSSANMVVAIHVRELDDSATGVAPIRVSSLPTMSPALAGMRAALASSQRPLRNTSRAFCVLISEKLSELAMYPWPIGNFDYIMDDALHIALDYLDRTGQAAMFQQVQSTAAAAIVAAWKTGVRHRIKLADIAIKAVERKAEPFLEYKRG